MRSSSWNRKRLEQWVPRTDIQPLHSRTCHDFPSSAPLSCPQVRREDPIGAIISQALIAVLFSRRDFFSQSSFSFCLSDERYFIRRERRHIFFPISKLSAVVFLPLRDTTETRLSKAMLKALQKAPLKCGIIYLLVSRRMF